MQIIEYKIAVTGGIIEMLDHKGRIVETPISQAGPFLVIGIRPVGRVGHQPIFDRIAVDITAQVQQVSFILDPFGLEGSLE